MKRIASVVTAVLVAALLFPALSMGEDAKKYKGKGEALIVNNDLPKAKRDALTEAFKSALQKAVGVYIKAKSKVENFEMTYSKILSESEGYVKNYKVLGEKTEDGIYSVEIEAEVAGEKLDDAFSQRLSRFVEKNLFSTFTIIASAMTSGNRFYNLTTTIMVMINDPTIEIDSIQIRLPKGGWIKPRITKSGLANLIMMTETIDPKNMASSRYIDDVVYFLEHRNANLDIRFKNPGTGKNDTRSITLEKLTMTASLGGGTSINILNREMKEVSDRDLADSAAALKKANTLLESEKKLIGMSGTLVLIVSTYKQGGSNYGQISISFSIPSSSMDISAIDAKSIELRLPVSGWIKPEVRESEYSIDVALNLTSTDPRSMKYLADMAECFDREAFALEMKYRDTVKKSVENRLAMISFMSVNISEEGQKIHDVQGKSFEKIDPGQRASIRSYLKKIVK
ncbi:MAG: flagellar assembly protein T N-terminal domain-containing protein [Spirochaetes bacterium]|nr:flagellar assembly protein T N-terminal domain-containing protein [Spirochaetota bacterium]